MTTPYETQQIELAAGEADEQGAPAKLDQVLEQIGARYIADLRALSEEFDRHYATQLAAKDQQIAELQRRLETAERTRDAREAQIRELKRASARYIADLRAMSEDLSRHVDLSEAEDNAFEVGRESP
jgi:hypothetical protein